MTKTKKIGLETGWDYERGLGFIEYGFLDMATFFPNIVNRKKVEFTDKKQFDKESKRVMK